MAVELLLESWEGRAAGGPTCKFNADDILILDLSRPKVLDIGQRDDNGLGGKMTKLIHNELQSSSRRWMKKIGKQKICIEFFIP